MNKNVDLKLFEAAMLDVSAVSFKDIKDIHKKYTTFEEITRTIKTILIDGSNLIRSMYKRKGNPDVDYKKDAKNLAIVYKFLNQYVAMGYDRIVIFLDGPKRNVNIQQVSGIEIEFSKTKKADDLIVNSVCEIKELQPNIINVKNEIEIVTSDKCLIERCIIYNKDIKIIKSDKFIKALGLSSNFLFI